MRESPLGEDTVSPSDASCRVAVSTGVIYDPTVQTCLFDGGWSPDTNGNDDNRRRLRSDEEASVAVCAAGAAEAVSAAQEEAAAKHDELQAELRELKALVHQLLAK